MRHGDVPSVLIPVSMLHAYIPHMFFFDNSPWPMSNTQTSMLKI